MNKDQRLTKKKEKIMNPLKGIINAFWMSAIIWLVIIGLAYASPFLICDPQVGVERYEITGWTPSTITAQADGSLGGAVQPSLSCYKNSCQVHQVN